MFGAHLSEGHRSSDISRPAFTGGKFDLVDLSIAHAQLHKHARSLHSFGNIDAFQPDVTQNSPMTALING